MCLVLPWTLNYQYLLHDMVNNLSKFAKQSVITERGPVGKSLTITTGLNGGLCASVSAASETAG